MKENSGKEVVTLEKLVLGNPVPSKFFLTSGVGESDLDQHTGSFHLALRDAGIEHFNIMRYSSILPAIASRIEKPEQVEGLYGMAHGSQLKTIMACADSKKAGERATAGLIWGWLYNRRTGEDHGGIVCEYYGKENICAAKQELQKRLDEVYSGYKERFRLENVDIATKSFVPKKKYGTALVAMCFVTFEQPIIGAKGSDGKIYPVVRVERESSESLWQIGGTHIPIQAAAVGSEA